MDIIEILQILIMLFSGFDLMLTSTYIATYKAWQPKKPYRLIEKNPLINLCLEKLGLRNGLLASLPIIFILNVFLLLILHWIILLVWLLIMFFVMYNHYKNFTLLGKLIDKYPNGHLPKDKFGEVIGNNKKEVKNV